MSKDLKLKAANHVAPGWGGAASAGVKARGRECEGAGARVEICFGVFIERGAER